jgi:uncharacterized protein
MDALRALAERHRLDAAVILNGVGMLRDAEIGYYQVDRAQYDRHTLREPHELLSYQGNLGRDAETGEVRAHVHVVLGGPDHRAIGGHLFDATVWVTNEVAVRRVKGVRFERRKNDATNLFDLALRR